MDFKYYSVREITAFLEKNELSINKKFGQNFLINSGVCDTIVQQLALSENDVVFEVGCGLGSLTNRLIASAAKRVVGFEIDRAYRKHLKSLFGKYESFLLIEEDFLTSFSMAVRRYVHPSDGFIITGNLPYYITTPILEKIFTATEEKHFQRAAFMMQKEVAERVVSKEGSKKYGSLSIFCQYYSQPKIIARISPASFYPKPNVDSAVVLFTQKPDFEKPENEILFFQLAKSLFINRRKQLKNNFAYSPFLKGIDLELILEAMKEVNIPLEERGENLSIDKIIELSNRINYLKQVGK